MDYKSRSRELISKLLAKVHLCQWKMKSHPVGFVLNLPNELYVVIHNNEFYVYNEDGVIILSYSTLTEDQESYTLLKKLYYEVEKKVSGETNTLLESLSFDNLKSAIMRKGKNRVAYTVEFYPEEGKYHYTGHRNCQIIYSPDDA